MAEETAGQSGKTSEDTTSGAEAVRPPHQHDRDLARSLLNALFVFAGILDLDGVLLEANDAPLEAASLRINDVQGRPFWDTYWWSYSADVQSRVRTAVERARSGENVRFDIDVRLADEKFATIDFQLSPMRDPSGRVSYLIASGVDISRRERAEAEQRRLARIVEEAPFLIRSATADGRVLYLNRHGRQMLGHPADSDLTNAEISHHHPEWALKLIRKEGYPAARRDGQWMGETAVIGTDGREVPVSHAIVAHRDRNGEVEYFSSIVADISSEKETAAALKESELRFRGTFENAAVGMAHVSLAGRWLRVNERLLDIVGYGRAELVQKTFQDITHPDDLSADLELFGKLKDGQIDSYSLEKRYFKKDGTLIWVEITVSMQETLGSAEPCVIAIVEEINERKQAEQRQRLLLAELNHRVKNTLAMIQSIANQTLRQSSDPGAFVTRFTGRLQSLSGAHDLLTKQTWDGADLAEFLRTQVSLNGTVDPGRVKLSGQSILLPPQIALNLALVIHELAANALQHGAFANESGNVAVSWTTATSHAADERTLTLVWKETGGPGVKQPSGQGYGGLMLERGLKRGLNGDYELKWLPEGMQALLTVPLPTNAFRTDLFKT